MKMIVHRHDTELEQLAKAIKEAVERQGGTYSEEKFLLILVVKVKTFKKKMGVIADFSTSAFSSSREVDCL